MSHDTNGTPHRDHRLDGQARLNGDSGRPLSAISHLFLSDHRGRENKPSPVRHPPAQQPMVEVVEQLPLAVIGTGLDADFDRRAAAVAASLMDDDVARVGLAIVDADGLRLLSIETDAAETFDAYETDDPRQAAAHVAELAGDVDAWVIALPDARLPRAARFLALADRWTLVTSADHEGVVAGYRTLKGLCDRAGLTDHEPTVTLALPDADHSADAERAARKLVGVCRQFLDVGVDGMAETTSTPIAWSSHVVLHALWRSGIDASPAWDALARHLAGDVAETTEPTFTEQPMRIAPPANTRQPVSPATPAGGDFGDIPFVDDSSIPAMARPMPTQPPVAASPTPEASAPAPAAVFAQNASSCDEVIDLPMGACVADILISREPGLAATAVKPPMLPSGRVAVDRDGRLVLVAAAAPGLADLARIGEAVAWIAQNRQLLSMALGQFRLDDAFAVQTRLLVSHADAGADALRPLLGSDEVKVHAYRRLTWGGRTGLLLDAA